IETDRRGSNFYYPRDSAVSKLGQAGLGADSLIVTYLSREVQLREAYKLFAQGLLEKITGVNEGNFEPFVLGFPNQA
ncbi:MAG TPA: hypothetical protein VGR56_01500, partial [Nitrososphaerales archaeon]|nr:hypothetical protein [Nitrososphaerales archaeon]